AVAGIVITTAVLGDALASFVWWAGVIVFFALIVYIAVNLANIVYFTRFARQKFNWFLNGVVPVIGIGIDAYLIYKSFFVSLWGAGTTGRSVVTSGFARVAVSILYVLSLKPPTPDRLTGSPIAHLPPAPEPGIHA